MSADSNKIDADLIQSINKNDSIKARKLLQKECIEVGRKIRLKDKGEKNLRKQVKRLFQDKSIAGFYIEEKNIYGMIVIFDEECNKFAGAYIARIDGTLSIYDSNIRFSLHSVERLIQRLKMKNPRLEVAKAIHSITKFVFYPENDFTINVDPKWRTPGLNEIDIASPYHDENDELIGMFFLTSISNISCTFVKAGVVKTFVDRDRLRDEQYRGCMEIYELQKKTNVPRRYRVMSNSSKLFT